MWKTILTKDNIDIKLTGLLHDSWNIMIQKGKLLDSIVVEELAFVGLASMALKKLLIFPSSN